jgi:hypothetical protein
VFATAHFESLAQTLRIESLSNMESVNIPAAMRVTLALKEERSDQ